MEAAVPRRIAENVPQDFAFINVNSYIEIQDVLKYFFHYIYIKTFSPIVQ